MSVQNVGNVSPYSAFGVKPSSPQNNNNIAANSVAEDSYQSSKPKKKKGVTFGGLLVACTVALAVISGGMGKAVNIIQEKGFLKGIGNAAKECGKTMFEAVKEYGGKAIDAVKGLFNKTGPIAKKAMDDIDNIAKGKAPLQLAEGTGVTEGVVKVKSDIVDIIK